MWFSKQPSSAEVQKGRRIYLDYASATPLLPEAVAAMREGEKLSGNPGSIHTEGVQAKALLTDARQRIASILGCKARELIFTSGLTESNNLGIIGYARALQIRGFNLDTEKSPAHPLAGTHWIVSAIEHDSVLECFSEVERLGGKVTHVKPNEKGIIPADRIAAALRPETVFVSIGWANNEIGTIQPLAKIARAIRAFELTRESQTFVKRKSEFRPIILHADAGQAPLYLSASVHSLGVDLLSLSASKLYGPHGVGALYVSERVKLAPIILGGSQERELRAGTESAALAAGFAAAFAVIAQDRGAESKRLGKLRDDFVRKIVAQFPSIVVNGDVRHALPHMLNVSIPHVDTEYLALQLDHAGIAVATKSACNEGEKASHVVEALADSGASGRSEHTLRFSFGRNTSEVDVQRAFDVLRAIIHI